MSRFHRLSALHFCVLYRYAKLLKHAVDPNGAGQGMYYSYNTNLTLSEQRNAEQQADTPDKQAWQQAEPRFFWNAFLAQPLTGVQLLWQTIPYTAWLQPAAVLVQTEGAGNVLPHAGAFTPEFFI